MYNLTDLVTLHVHNYVFGSQSRPSQTQIGGFCNLCRQYTVLSTAWCLHRCVLRPTKEYQDTLQVVQCFLKAAYYLAVCSARRLCSLHMLYCSAQGARECSTCLWTRHQGLQRKCDGKLMPMSLLDRLNLMPTSFGARTTVLARFVMSRQNINLATEAPLSLLIFIASLSCCEHKCKAVEGASV